jgi:hypothetical protein
MQIPKKILELININFFKFSITIYHDEEETNKTNNELLIDNRQAAPIQSI